MREIESLLAPPPGTPAELKADPARVLADSGKPPDPWQAELLRAEPRNTLLLCSRQSGKSTVAAALAIRAVLEPDSLVLLLSPGLRQSGELFRDKLMRAYSGLGRPVKVVQESALTMELANGSRVVSLPGDEETVRGFSGVRLLVIDEASRVPDDLYRAVRPMLAVSGGTLVALSTPFGKRGWFYEEWQGQGEWLRVRVPASECPRIPAAFLEDERRAMGEQWFRQEYGVEFLDSAGEPLFPPAWLDHANRLAREYAGRERRAEAIGVDPGLGASDTCMVAVDRLGVIELTAKKTPDTNVIIGDFVAFMRRHYVPARMCAFDAGGGGDTHAHRLRAMGHDVRIVGFGETVTPEPLLGRTGAESRTEARHARLAYRLRRSQMYGQLRQLLDPAGPAGGFAIPHEYAELRRQLAPIPLTYDEEGRLELPPKQKRGDSNKPTLVQLIGCSPDHGDALALAVHAMLHPPRKVRVGAMW